MVRGLNPPYRLQFGMPSYDVCACCGFEFGNDDDPGTAAPISFDEYFDEWLSQGCKWFDERMKPLNWSLAEQMHPPK
jgi:hypothetical protein